MRHDLLERRISASLDAVELLKKVSVTHEQQKDVEFLIQHFKGKSTSKNFMCDSSGPCDSCLMYDDCLESVNEIRHDVIEDLLLISPLLFNPESVSSVDINKLNELNFLVNRYSRALYDKKRMLGQQKHCLGLKREVAEVTTDELNKLVDDYYELSKVNYLVGFVSCMYRIFNNQINIDEIEKMFVDILDVDEVM